MSVSGELARARVLALGKGDDGGRAGRLAEAFESMGIRADAEYTATAAELLAAARTLRPTLAFATFHRIGDEGLREILAREGVVLVGGSTATLDLCLDKPALKATLRRRGVPTPSWVASREGLEAVEDFARRTGFPLIVKPAAAGNSAGIAEDSVAEGLDDLRRLVAGVAGAWGEAIVERFVGGAGAREFTACLIGEGARAAVGVAEVLKPGRVVTVRDKEAGRARAVPVENGATRLAIAALARAAFRAAGARHYARCDLALAGDEAAVLEVNGQPMLPDQWFSACAFDAGVGDPGYLAAIAASAARGGAR